MNNRGIGIGWMGTVNLDGQMEDAGSDLRMRARGACMHGFGVGSVRCGAECEEDTTAFLVELPQNGHGSEQGGLGLWLTTGIDVQRNQRLRNVATSDAAQSGNKL